MRAHALAHATAPIARASAPKPILTVRRCRMCTEMVAGQPAPTPAPTKGATKKAGEMKEKLTSKIKDKVGKFDYAGSWEKAKKTMWKGLELMEAVSNKDLNMDGNIEGRKKPQTKAEKEAQWKREHEERKGEHEKKRKEYEARKAAGQEHPSAAGSAPAAPLSKEEREVVVAIQKLLAGRFQNDREKMFKNYDADGTDSLDHGEVRQVVKDAGVRCLSLPARS